METPVGTLDDAPSRKIFRAVTTALPRGGLRATVWSSGEDSGARLWKTTNVGSRPALRHPGVRLSTIESVDRPVDEDLGPHLLDLRDTAARVVRARHSGGDGEDLVQ